MNNAPIKTFKEYVFGTKKLKNKQKLQFIGTYEKHGPILTIQKSLTMKWFKVSKKRFFI
jgi:hypothetical protein